MKNVKKRILTAAVLLCALGIYYYVALPAISIHSMDFWIFLIVAVLLFFVRGGVFFSREKNLDDYLRKKKKKKQRKIRW